MVFTSKILKAAENYNSGLNDLKDRSVINTVIPSFEKRKPIY